MNLAAIDHLAVNHRCWLQRCSPLAKVLFIGVVLAFLLTSRSLPFLGGLLALLLVLVISNRLPLGVLLPLALLPMVFAAVFAVSVGDWRVGLLLVGRAGTAALLAGLVFVTTAPVRLLALLSAPLPGVFGELLFFTYRSFFILAAGLENTLRAVRLRSGEKGFSWARLKVLSQVYGMTLARAWDLAGRQYDLLRLRGLGAGLKFNRDWRLRVGDLGLLALAVLMGMGWYCV